MGVIWRAAKDSDIFGIDDRDILDVRPGRADRIDGIGGRG